MSPRYVSRRGLLRTGTAVTALGLLGSLAGCQSPLDGGSGGASPPRMDAVPNGADAIAHLDVDGLLADSELRGQVNDALSESGVAGTVEDALDGAESETGLDPRGVREALAFGAFEGASPNGTVLWADWSQSELFDAVREGAGSASETTYGDTTVLRVESGLGADGAVGTLEEGVFAVGAAATVEAVVDRWRGDADPIGGEVSEAYASTPEGYARFGFDVPTEQLPEEAGGPLDASVLRDLNYGYGSLTGERALVVNLRASGEDAAADAASVIESGMALTREELRGGSTTSQGEWVRGVIEATTVDQQGRTVVVRTERGGQAAALAVAVAGAFVVGIGSRSTRPAPPQVAFSVEYDADARELQVAHDGGDIVPATQLFVRGEGVETGRWDRLGGSASGGSDGPAVAAGDRLTLSDVPADYRVLVVWESEESDATAVLVEAEGPGA